ncbi:glycosyltransferase 8 domain-containing protein 2 isoform X1 [Poecilia reticulata]|uniref:glycosyltransferase 8 domain-containing protein 2 isoform X1 n=1 Tax=Poecilia reticulata TaxID=8081 RepID=UPI0004A32490|nr:PREDICTED: glycosyltransferase 8 domain-containing protein 2 isoform X1 [Poecilia reticulata]
MPLLKKINQVLIVLLVLLACLLLHSSLKFSTQPKKAYRQSHGLTADLPAEEVETDDVVPVIICASEERTGATMATINSIISNTDSSVFFYIVTLRDAVKIARRYIEKTKLKGIQYKILEFNPMVLRGKVKPDSSRPDLLHPVSSQFLLLNYVVSTYANQSAVSNASVSDTWNNLNCVLQLNFVRFYLPLLGISHRRVIYVDDDVIVQGDIKDLYNIKLKTGHAAAFASDCDLPFTHEMVRSIGMQTTYMGFLDYRKQEVKDLAINPNHCSFNPGVFVAEIKEWKKQKITKQLERWMEENFRQNIYSSAMAGGVATPPMLIVFHDKYTALDPLWHVRHLGWSPNARYAESFLQGAQLLHWNGPFKPWNDPAVHSDLWKRWFIPDPSGRFTLTRPGSDS